MAVRIPVGYEFFEEIRRDGSYYVDKTGLVVDLLERANDKVTLFCRPRRFGKTLNMTMLQSFLDMRRESRWAFEGLEVTRHPDLCERWMNSRPVVLVSLKDVEGLTFESAYSQLEYIVSEECGRLSFLAKSESTSVADRQTFERLWYRSASTAELRGSLRLLTRMMAEHFGRPCVLLVDEYDVPLAKAAEEKEGGERYYPQMLEVVRGLLSSSLKTNEWLERAVLTGCLRIAKESIFTGVNNFRSYTVLDEGYADSFGFTQTEVDELLSACGISHRASTFRDCYDGYTFGSRRVYNPWDVVSYASALMRNSEAAPKSYWRHSSGNGTIRELASQPNGGARDALEALMNGGVVRKAIVEGLTYDTIQQSEDGLWSLLLMSGYLTKADASEQAQEGEDVSLRIPNREVAGIFQEEVMTLFSRTADEARVRALVEALWKGDQAAASDVLSDLLWDTISYMDYSEDYYHAFLAGVFVGRGYDVESNKERGLGRPDILLRDHRNRRALVIEAKRSSSEKSMPRDCEVALAQIASKGYDKGLRGYRQIMRYGVAFFEKQALMRLDGKRGDGKRG